MIRAVGLMVGHISFTDITQVRFLYYLRLVKFQMVNVARLLSESIYIPPLIVVGYLRVEKPSILSV